MILLSHPTGNQPVRETLAAFDDAGLLAEYATTVSWRGGSLSRLVPPKLRSTAERRRYAASLQSRIRTHPVREMLRLVLGPRLRGRLVAPETGALSFDAVARAHDAWTARRIRKSSGVTAVYAYEDCALDTFQAAKKRGIACIFEHPVGYWRDLERTYREEVELRPEYAPVLMGLTDSAAKRARKDEELASADFLVVPSQASLRTLQEFPGKLPPTITITYGAPWECVAAPVVPTSTLRVLFVGSLQQRKGVSYFVDAIRLCGSAVSTTVVGGRIADCAPLDRFLSEVTWIPSTPHARVLELMRSHDVLVLPSLSEGFGIVVLEAMTQGMTVIVSDKTGAADVVQDQVNGFVVPIRSAEAIAQRLTELARDPERLMAVKRAALDSARTHSLETYRRAIVEAVRPYVRGGS